MLLKKAQPVVWLFREDNEEVLTADDKYMNDWVDPYGEAMAEERLRKGDVGPHPGSRMAMTAKQITRIGRTMAKSLALGAKARPSTPGR